MVEIEITPDGHMRGRREDQIGFLTFPAASEDLIRNVHGVAEVAKLDRDEIDHLFGNLAELKWRR
jgi:hypothetical protein